VRPMTSPRKRILMRACGENKGRFLFLKKKKQKNFCPLDRAGETDGGLAK